jgi:hypothetical protein
MHRISSRWTFFYKRVFPVIWFGFLALFLCISLFVVPRSSQTATLPLLIMPIVMMVFGYFIMTKFVFDLVDEVWDDDDVLVVKNRDQTERIALADIKNVNYAAMINPPRVTLSLRRPSLFGDKVTFCAPIRFVPFSTSPIIDELIERIDSARQRQR